MFKGSDRCVCAAVSHTRASTEQVFRAYTDFTDRRLEIWRDTLEPKNYELRERGKSWAVVREGSLKTGVVLRYEWTEPGSVRWSMLESTFCEVGAGRLDIRHACSRGAHVEVLIEERGGKGLLGPVVLGLKGLLGPLVLPRTSKRALDQFAKEDSHAR